MSRKNENVAVVCFREKSGIGIWGALQGRGFTVSQNILLTKSTVLSLGGPQNHGKPASYLCVTCLPGATLPAHLSPSGPC